jgi:hypothetical protein
MPSPRYSAEAIAAEERSSTICHSRRQACKALFQ